MLIGLLATAGVAVGVLALLGAFAGPEHHVPPSGYAFDSLYEVRRAESLVTERILDREMAAEERKHEREENKPEQAQPELGGQTGVKSERCVVSPPPPEATRMLCRVVVSIEELRQTSKRSHDNRWSAVVTLGPHDGVLTVRLSKLNGEA